jgi:shikimate kinase
VRKIKVNGANSAASRNRNQMGEGATDDAVDSPQEAALLAALGRRSVVLVGMMGAGKSSIGRRLAQRLGVTFVDADAEIEAAAGMTIAEIFATYGEPYFRSGEQRVIARLLESGPKVLATGGGAFINPETRAGIRQKGVSVWLKAEFEVLMRRVKRRATADRPMLQGDPAQRIRHLMDERYPVYAEADVTVMSREVSHEIIVNEIVSELARVLGVAAAAEATQ